MGRWLGLMSPRRYPWFLVLDTKTTNTLPEAQSAADCAGLRAVERERWDDVEPRLKHGRNDNTKGNRKTIAIAMSIDHNNVRIVEGLEGTSHFTSCHVSGNPASSHPTSHPTPPPTPTLASNLTLNIQTLPAFRRTITKAR